MIRRKSHASYGWFATTYAYTIGVWFLINLGAFHLVTAKMAVRLTFLVDWPRQSGQMACL